MSIYEMPHVKSKQIPLPKWQPHPYSVVPMLVIAMEGNSRGLFTYMLDYEKVMDSSGGCFYIKGVQGHNILVDSGPSLEDFLAHGYPCREVKTMQEALKEATGLSPDDIDVVILTHLHHDHCALAGLFKHAQIIVQKDEWKALHDPPACYRPFYDARYMDGLDLTFVDGDVFNVFPGIHLLYTPGHSSGGQSVVVDTNEGRVIISGVCGNESIFNPPEAVKAIWPEVLVPGLHVNNEDAYESALRIKREADYIITLHDPKSFERGECPGPNWPRY